MCAISSAKSLNLAGWHLLSNAQQSVVAGLMHSDEIQRMSAAEARAIASRAHTLAHARTRARTRALAHARALSRTHT
eukprot:140704-Pleurochrysis_carterae.AAC.1